VVPMHAFSRCEEPRDNPGIIFSASFFQGHGVFSWQ
jgi:hypothetical protein